jgi:hypothetical protein
MPLSLISSLIGGGGGIGFNDSSTSSTTNSSSNTNTSQNATGTQSKVLTPYQSALQAPLFNYVSGLMTQSGAEAAVAPYTAAAMDSTNSSYAGLANTLRDQFLSTGNGQSGKYGSALVQGNLARLGALQGVQTTGQEEAAALPLSAASLATSLLGQNFGQTSTASQTGTSATTGTSSTKSSSSGFSL